MNSSKVVPRDDRTSAWEWWWAFGGSLLWTLILAAIRPTLFEGLDFSRFCDPVLTLLRTSLQNGEMPWWNPYSSLGRPFAADMQTASFYPASYLSVFFGLRMGGFIATAAHGMLAIWGFTRLMHWIGVARPAAWGGAVVFLFSAPLVARMQAGQVPYVYALCYIPLVLCCAGRLAAAPTLRHWAALALVWGLQLLCSHPQVSWLSALGAGAFVTGWLMQPPWPKALWVWLRTTFGLLTAFFLGMALLGFVILPFLELAGQSDRAESSLAFSAGFPMATLHWISLIAVPSSAFPINWEFNLHFGVVALLGGLAALSNLRNPAMRGVAVMVAVGLAIAVGNETPLFAVLFKILPGLSNFRIPARAGVLVIVGLIVGAAVLAGTPQLRRASRSPNLFVAGLLIAAVAYYHYSHRMRTDAESVRWIVGRLALVCAATVGWLLWLEQKPGEEGKVSWARRLFLPGALAVELCLAIPGLKYSPSLPARYPTETVVVAAIQSNGLDRQIAPVRVCLPPRLVRENSGMIHRYATLTGFESLSLFRVWNYLHLAAGANANYDHHTMPAGEVYDRAASFGSLNLTVLLPPGSSVPSVATAPDPRAYLAMRITPVADAQVAMARMVAGHPFHEDALVEQAWAEGLEVGASASPGSAAITKFTMNSVEVAVDSPAAALLVVAEAWYPGWRASIAGRSVACLPVNGWMRGVPVPAGRSTVQLTYHQNGLRPGLVVSLLAALVLVWAACSRRPTNALSAM